MNQIEKDFQEELQNNEIGHLNINYKKYEIINGVYSIARENKDPLLLTNIYPCGKKSRLILQDLNGNELKELITFTDGVATVDDEKIYAFLKKDGKHSFYRFDKNTLELEYEHLFPRSNIRSIYCDGKVLCTYDELASEIQIRDKNGEVLSRKTVDNRWPINLVIYSANKNFCYERTGVPVGDNKCLNRYKEKYGEEVIELDSNMKDMAYDEQTNTTFKASKHIIYVNNDVQEGLLYYPDEIIFRISFDSHINSLIISKFNSKNMSVEILPMSQILYKMVASAQSLMTSNEELLQTEEDYIEIEKAPLIRRYTKLQ